jgi:hypothetical protein
MLAAATDTSVPETGADAIDLRPDRRLVACEKVVDVVTNRLFPTADVLGIA